MRLRTALVAVVTGLALTGCGTETEPTSGEAAPSVSESPATEPSPTDAGEEPSAEPEPEPEPAGPSATITISGDSIDPNGKRIDVPVGEPLTLRITSDRAAELHVHSSPEQVVAVKAGTSTKKLTIDTPGVIDVEEHDTGIVILQLEVR